MDPYAVLGLHADASDEEVLSAYRDLAKQLHPDVAGGAAAHAQMAQLNAAFDAIRAREEDDATAPGRQRGPGRDAPGAQGDRAGHWLSDRMRGALAPELLAPLELFEDVRLVTRATTWKHADVLLAVTDRRLLWLPAHAIRPEVSTLRHADVTAVEQQVRRPLRRTAVVRLTQVGGVRHEFADLTPPGAALVVRNVQDGMRG